MPNLGESPFDTLVQWRRYRHVRNAVENLNEHMSQATPGPGLVHFAFVTHHVLRAMGIGPTGLHFRGIALDRIRHSQLFLTYNEYNEHTDNFNAALRFARERAANRLQPPRPDRPDVSPDTHVYADLVGTPLRSARYSRTPESTWISSSTPGWDTLLYTSTPTASR